MSVPSEGVTVTLHIWPLERKDEETEVESSNALTTEEFRLHRIVVPDSESPSESLYVYVKLRVSVVVGFEGSITKLVTDGAWFCGGCSGTEKEAVFHASPVFP